LPSRKGENNFSQILFVGAFFRRLIVLNLCHIDQFIDLFGQITFRPVDGFLKPFGQLTCPFNLWHGANFESSSAAVVSPLALIIRHFRIRVALLGIWMRSKTEDWSIT
jgi:hypothetical protein